MRKIDIDDDDVWKRKGGKMRKIHIDDDDVYGWWIMGIDMMEQGVSQHLAGIKLMRKAVLLMADKHDKIKGKMTDSE